MRKIMMVIFLGLFYGGAWFSGALYLEKKIKSFQEYQSKKFRTFNYKEISIKGFPFRYEIHLDQPFFQGPLKNLGLSVGGDLNAQWQGEKCILVVKLWEWRTFKIQALGKHIMHYMRESHPGFTISFDQALGTVSLNNHCHVAHIEWEANQPTLSYYGGETIAKAENFSLDFRKAHQINAEGNIAVDKIECSIKQLIFPHGSSLVIDNCQFELSILNPFSRGPLLRALKTWRDDGGTIEIHLFCIDWQKIELSLKGTLSLDQNLCPLAAMVLKVNDYSKILQFFVEKKWLKPKEALTANLAFSLMKDSASPEIEIPISIQEAKMSLGPLLFSPIPSLETLLKV